MVSQPKWAFRFSSANNASFCHHTHSGVTLKGQVTASARQNKKWASLLGDPSAPSARTHTGLHEHPVLWQFVRSPYSRPVFRGWQQMPSKYSYNLRADFEGTYFGPRRSRNLNQSRAHSLFPFSSLLDARKEIIQYWRSLYRPEGNCIFSIPALISSNQCLAALARVVL